MRIPRSFLFSSVLSAISVACLGVLTLSWATNSFSIWTAEDARRVRALADESGLPNTMLLDQHEERRLLMHPHKQFVVLDFIYTRCPTVCNTLGFKFKQLEDELTKRDLGTQVEVLSISFDLKYDSPQALGRYLSHHKAKGLVWSAAVPPSDVALEALKQRFGVVVIDDEFGGFTHNAAIYVIENGELKKIFNDDEVDSVVAYIETSLTSAKRRDASG